MRLRNKIQGLAFIVLVIGIIGLAGYGLLERALESKAPLVASFDSTEAHTLLLLEVFESIKKNYWVMLDEQKLKELFGLAVARVATGTPPFAQTATSTRSDFADYLTAALSPTSSIDRKSTTLSIARLVLNNLEPFGRNDLFTLSQEKELRNTVNNINPSKDLYASLGVAKDASVETIKNEYDKKVAVLSQNDTPEAREEMKQISYVKDVLTDEKKKTLYDERKIEPTLFLTSVSKSTWYLNLTKFSPTTLQEFVDAMAKIGTNAKSRNLIIDMRGNIGGSLDIVPYLSGFFIGQNQYAFDLFKLGTYTPFKTPTQKLPELNGLRKIIVLIDGNTQSSAELFTTVLKKYNRATVVGTRSKGWGTIENTFPLATTLEGDRYTLYLVHSITLREDGQPIEGRGVDPDIDTGNTNWQAVARDRLEDNALVGLLEQILNNRP